MKYPVKISRNLNNNVLILSVPDLPGCQVSTKTIDEGLKEVSRAIADHLSILSEYGEAIPHASEIDNVIARETSELSSTGNTIWAVVDFDIIPYLGKSQKINVTLPELLIRKIDAAVSKSEQHKSRSGFIASACVNELNK